MRFKGCFQNQNEKKIKKDEKKLWYKEMRCTFAPAIDQRVVANIERRKKRLIFICRIKI